jgi:predicted dehydrogenase
MKQKKSPLSMTRRDALKTLGIGAASYSLSGCTTVHQSYIKNETINIGLIGCGGRMRGALVRGLGNIPEKNIVAVCDVYDDFLNSAHVLVGGRDREVQKTKYYEELLNRKDIDAVIVATPDHWHVPITIDAVEAGKHVYVEKPVTHNLVEGQQLIEAVRRTGMTVQVGAQQRTMPHLVVLKQKLDSGEINLGKVTRVHMQWCRNTGPYYGDPSYRITEDQVDWKRFLGNAPDQPFDALRMRNWRWIWDFGNGPLGDLMVHWLDATNWLLDLPLPSQVIMSGGKYHRKGRVETPDVTNCIMEFPERDLQMDYVSSWSNNYLKACTIIMGTEATVYFDRNRYEVTPQKGGNDPLAPISESMIASKGPRGTDHAAGFNAETYHLSDWMEAIRENRDPVDNVEAGVQAAAVCHYGNISYREKRFVQV